MQQQGALCTGRGMSALPAPPRHNRAGQCPAAICGSGRFRQAQALLRQRPCPSPGQVLQQRRRLQPPRAQPGGLGDEDVDVAVFRFTLGIPGFDDSRIPQVVGAVVAALVAVNHALGVQPAPAAQVRSEFLVVLLAVLCVAAPEVEARLRQAAPTRGRVAAASALPGAGQVFALAQGLPEALQLELAWSSRALLVNANCCTVAVLRGQQPLLVRGAVSEAALPRAPPAQAAASGGGGGGGGSSGQGGARAAADSSAAVLQAVQQALQPPQLPGQASAVLSGAQQQLFLPDAASIRAAGLQSWAWLAPTTACLLLAHVPGPEDGALLLVASDRPRGLSEKDIRWTAAMAAKLSTVVS